MRKGMLHGFIAALFLEFGGGCLPPESNSASEAYSLVSCLSEELPDPENGHPIDMLCDDIPEDLDFERLFESLHLNLYVLPADTIEKLSKEKVPLAYATPLLSLRDHNGNPVFTDEQVITYHQLNGTFDNAIALLELRNENNNPLFTGQTIVDYAQQKRHDVFFAEALAAYHDTKGPLFTRAKDIVGYAQSNKDLDFLEEIMRKAWDTAGNSLYRGSDFRYLAQASVSVDDAVVYASFRRDDGTLWMKGRDLALYLASGGDLRNAEWYFDNTSFSGYAVARFKELGLSQQETVHFVDTAERPNAIIILPYSDHNRAFENERMVTILKEIIEAYDTWVRVVETEDEVYSALDEIPQISHLFAAGHGTMDSLELKEGTDERFRLTPDDTELCDHMDNVDLDSTFFLFSCSNAKGGTLENNFANFVIACSGQKTVIAGRDSFSSTDIHISSYNPFSAKIIKEKTDIGYSNNASVLR